MTNHVTNSNHMIAVNGILIFTTKRMGSLNCLKKRKLEGETEDCFRQIGKMRGIVTFVHTGRILKLAQMSEC